MFRSIKRQSTHPSEIVSPLTEVNFYTQCTPSTCITTGQKEPTPPYLWPFSALPLLPGLNLPGCISITSHLSLCQLLQVPPLFVSRHLQFHPDLCTSPRTLFSHLSPTPKALPLCPPEFMVHNNRTSYILNLFSKSSLCSVQISDFCSKDTASYVALSQGLFSFSQGSCPCSDDSVTPP